MLEIDTSSPLLRGCVQSNMAVVSERALQTMIRALITALHLLFLSGAQHTTLSALNATQRYLYVYTAGTV